MRFSKSLICKREVCWYSSHFKKDVRGFKKQRKDLRKIDGKNLPAYYRDHPLRGKWKQYREIHMEDDWLLICLISGNELQLVATGSHSELFEK
jgi:mRNA interferase YafQ